MEMTAEYDQRHHISVLFSVPQISVTLEKCYITQFFFGRYKPTFVPELLPQNSEGRPREGTPRLARKRVSADSEVVLVIVYRPVR
jgi:hypothetical protein